MMALLSFILSIIMAMMTKQKKESAKRITGKANPTKKEISKAYKILVSDIKLLYKHKYNVNKVSRAMYVNMNPRKYAKNGVSWYQESQFELDRVLGNMNKEQKIDLLHGYSIDIRKQIDYIPLYFKFLTNSFMFQNVARYWLKMYKNKERVVMIDLMQDSHVVQTCELFVDNDLNSLLNRFFSNLPVCFLGKAHIPQTNQILNERRVISFKWLQQACGPNIPLLYKKRDIDKYHNIWKVYKNAKIGYRYFGIRGDNNGRQDQPSKRVVLQVEKFYEYYKTNKEIATKSMWTDIMC